MDKPAAAVVVLGSGWDGVLVCKDALTGRERWVSHALYHHAEKLSLQRRSNITAPKGALFIAWLLFSMSCHFSPSTAIGALLAHGEWSVQMLQRMHSCSLRAMASKSGNDLVRILDLLIMWLYNLSPSHHTSRRPRGHTSDHVSIQHTK